jgi:S-(hydroxymethyl)glutathione dehydrogenase/alcohol dehydrogenase
MGQLFLREVNVKTGQCSVKNYNEMLLHLRERGRVHPTKLISHTMKLDDAQKAYDMFDKKGDVTKNVLTP